MERVLVVSTHDAWAPLCAVERVLVIPMHDDEVFLHTANFGFKLLCTRWQMF